MAGSSPQAEEISTSGSQSCTMSDGSSSTSNVVYNLSASPRQSKPGPRLALVAGTRTATRDCRNIAILPFTGTILLTLLQRAIKTKPRYQMLHSSGDASTSRFTGTLLGDQ